MPHGLVVNVDALLKQEIFDVFQRQGVADKRHHRGADDLGWAEIPEVIVHQRLARRPYLPAQADLV